MLFLAGGDAEPTDPLTAELTPVLQVLGVVGAIVIVLAIVVLVARFVARRRDRSFPRPLTVAAVIAGCLGVIALVMSLRAGAPLV